MIPSAGSTFILASLLAHLLSVTSNPLVLPLTNKITSLNASSPQCIDSPDWTTPSFLGGDCITALDKFHNRKVDHFGGMVLEFYAAGIAPSYPSRFSQPTPQKYKYKTCTLAIVLLKDLPGGAVPGTNFPSTDLSSYVWLEHAAKDVYQRCISVVLDRGRGVGGGVGFVNPTGYVIAGNKESIGVFLWDTNSVINQQIQVADSAGPTIAHTLNSSSLQGNGRSGSRMMDTS